MVSERLQDGKLTLPGGLIEPEESPIKAAVRELWEETGLVIKKDDLIEASSGPISVPTADQNLKFYAFFAFWDEATGESPPLNPEPNKHGPWKWLTVNKIAAASTRGRFPPSLFGGHWLEEALSQLEIAEQLDLEL